MCVDQSLVDAAIQQALQRFPSGYAGAAAIRTNAGRILTSVGLQAPYDAVSLCHETGAFCEAYRLGEQVVASVCVSRSQPDRPFLILPPCGVCQERLALWGPEVAVAVSVPGKLGAWQSKLLREVNPHYWLDAVRDAGE